MRIVLTSLLACLSLAGTAQADACKDQLATFRAALSGDKAGVLAAASTLRASNACNAVTTQRALSQASAVLARQAQGLVAAGDLTGAEAALEGAPALHWAVQAVRGDIAAARGNRKEAAQLYNAALDTITDPALTPPDARLGPVADRIARLAQENMMLAGTLSAALTRGGQASGVLRAAVRGISIEQVPKPVVVETKPKPEPEVIVKADETKPEEIPGQVIGGGGDVVVKADENKTPSPVYLTPKPVTDPYAGKPKEDFVVADAVAKETKAIFLPIRFAFNSDQLDEAGIYEAETVANFLKSNHISQITLQGHTDEIGSDAFNLDLSLRRALTVRDFLLRHGVTAYINAEGLGESDPPNLVDPHIYTDEERRAIARRVELVLEG